MNRFIIDISFWLVWESTNKEYHSNGTNSKKFGIWWRNSIIYIISCAFLVRIRLLWQEWRNPSAKIYSHWPLMHPLATICAGNWLTLGHFALINYTIWCCFTLCFMSDLKNRGYSLFLYYDFYQRCMDLSQISTSDGMGEY